MIYTKDKLKGIEMVNKALLKIEEVIKAKKGNFLKKYEPKVIGDREEASLLAEQQELAPSDDEEEEGSLANPKLVE